MSDYYSIYHLAVHQSQTIERIKALHGVYDYRLTNRLMFLCAQIQSPRPNVMFDRREGIARAEGL